MNIYVNGDSFAAGIELTDWVLPGFPGYSTTESPITTTVPKEVKDWYRAKDKIASKYFGSFENYGKAQKNLAWPAELGKLDTTLFVYNGGWGGASMTGIAHRTVADLLTLKAKGIVFDRVFIQLTSSYRFEIYDSTLIREKFIVDRPFGWIDTLASSTQQELGKCYIEQYKNEDLAIKFLYNLCTLKQAVKGLTGYEPIILSSISEFTTAVIDPLKNNPAPLIQLLLNESGILDILPEYCMQTVHRDNNFLYCPGMHFEHRTHQAYAKIIYNKYINYDTQ
jgi:hypothetical protein